MRRRVVPTIVAWGVCTAAAALGCTGPDDRAAACARTVDVDLVADPGSAGMLHDLADAFNASDAAKPPDDAGAGAAACTRVVVHELAASRAEALLAGGWQPGQAPDDLPEPVVWAPGSSMWATLLDQRRSATGDRAIAYDVTPIARSPLVVAVPRSRAEAIGWPDRPISLEDLVRLAGADLGSGCSEEDAPAGMRLLVERWCAEDWGPFRLGKANPELSASGLAALVVQAYASIGEVEGLEVEDLDDRWVVRFATAAEAAVARYADDPRRFLETLHRAGARAGAEGDGGRADPAPAPDVTGVVVEEKAVIDYNRGDPAGALGPGESGVRPADRLVALYPAGGTVELDHPLVVLDVPWAAAERDGARRFVGYVRSPDVQRRVLDHGFRPFDPGVEVEGPLFTPSGYGVEPDPAVPTLPTPDAAVLEVLRRRWHEQRRPARVLLVADVSGSMGDPTDIHDADSPTKLDLARRALTAALDRFEDDDEVGLWVFSTALTGPGATPDGRVRERVPPRRMDARDGRQRRTLSNAIGALRPRNDTALYAATRHARDVLADGYDPDRINAVILLTDGHDESGGTADERTAARRELLDDLDAPARRDRPVPIFTVAYGGDADVDVLRQIAAATSGAFHDSTDPTAIDVALAEAVGSV